MGFWLPFQLFRSTKRLQGASTASRTTILSEDVLKLDVPFCGPQSQDLVK